MSSGQRDGVTRTYVSTLRLDLHQAAPRRGAIRYRQEADDSTGPAVGPSDLRAPASTGTWQSSALPWKPKLERGEHENSGSSTSKPTSNHKEVKDTNPQRKISNSQGAATVVEFVDCEEQLEVQSGEEARLHCSFQSSCLPAACCWIYNREKVVVGGPKTHISSGPTESSLLISHARPDDSGSYTLVVRNRQGISDHTICLSVIEPPAAPASPPVASQFSACSLVLSWTGPGYDGGSAVLGYVVEVRSEAPGEAGGWTEVVTRCKNTTYRVRSGLEPQGCYCFRVRAYNSAGVSEPSEESCLVKMERAGKATGKGEVHSYITVTVDTTHKVADHYNVHEKLGMGKFGQVFRLSHKDTGNVYAGKFYRARTSKERAAARAEMEIMNCLHHPKLVECVAAYDTRSEVVMVMDYIAGGELFERIVDENFEHTELTSARYVQQILEGIRYVHKQNIIHLDLKPENIVCVNATGTQIKIIDFGLASKLEPGKDLLVMHGTPEFVAPEVIGYEPVGLETDMWSIGVICFILLSGESPFQGNSEAETLALVTAAKFQFDEESFEDISEQAREFISSLLKKDRRCRLSCDEALAHPWMVAFTPLTHRPTKTLKKDKMKRFLARRKWKKAGKAVQALRRMANLSNRPEPPGGLAEEPSWSPEAERAIQSLEEQLQSGPHFQETLLDTVLPCGAMAHLTCLIHGYPQPEVEWFQNGERLVESSRVTTEHSDTGSCALVLMGLRPSDAGIYTCRATNGQGEALCSAKLSVGT